MSRASVSRISPKMHVYHGVLECIAVALALSKVMPAISAEGPFHLLHVMDCCHIEPLSWSAIIQLSFRILARYRDTNTGFRTDYSDTRVAFLHTLKQIHDRSIFQDLHKWGCTWRAKRDRDIVVLIQYLHVLTINWLWRLSIGEKVARWNAYFRLGCLLEEGRGRMAT